MSKYPEIYAGAKLTAARLDAMIPEIIVKTETTERASTTTLTLDPELQFEAEANASYYVHCYLMPAGLLAAGFKTEWQIPGDANMLKSVLGPSSTANNSQANDITVRMGVHQAGTDMVYSCVRDGPTLGFLVQEYGLVHMVSAGTVGLAWAQNSSNSTPTRLFASSFMVVRRVA